MDYRRTVKEFFLVGIRNDLPNDFNFPKTIPLKLRLKDILEDIVDEKYYLSEKLIKGFMSKPSIESFPFTPMDINTDKVCPTITARIHKCSSSDPYLKVSNIGNVNPSGNGMNGNVFSDEGLCPTLTTNKGEGIKVQVKSERIAGWFENENVIGAYRDDAKRSSVSEHIYQKENSVCNTIQTAHVPKLIQEVKIGAMRGRNPENPSDRTPGAPTQQMLEINENGTSNCLTSVQKDNLVVESLFNSEEIHIFTRNNTNGKILLELLEEIGICEIEEWLLGITEPIEKEEILQSEMYVGSIHEKNKETSKGYINPLQQSKSTKIITKFIMRGLQSKEWYRCSPQRRKSTKQFIRKFAEIMSVLPCKETQSRDWLQSSELQRKTQWTWFLREALSEIQKIRKSTSNESERSFRIRKLTPLEAFRLQGFPDDFKKPVSNSQLYKQAGNTISVNVIQAILKNLLK